MEKMTNEVENDSKIQIYIFQNFCFSTAEWIMKLKGNCKLHIIQRALIEAQYIKKREEQRTQREEKFS